MDENEPSRKQPIKNRFECSGKKEMSHCPVYQTTNQTTGEKLCVYRSVANNDWIKHIAGLENITLLDMLNKFIAKKRLETISVMTVGKRVDLSDKITQIVFPSLSSASQSDLQKSNLILLTYGDFKSEIEFARKMNYCGPVAIYSDDSLVKKYAHLFGASDVCYSKEDVFKAILNSFISQDLQ